MEMPRVFDKPAAYHFQMNTEVAVPSKILEPVNQTTCWQIQEDRITIHSCEHIRSWEIQLHHGCIT